jgi:hypothetical protein
MNQESNIMVRRTLLGTLGAQVLQGSASGPRLVDHNFSFDGWYSCSYADYCITKIKDSGSGGTTFRVVDMKAAVYLQTSDIPNDPLAAEQWYSADTNQYQKRSYLLMYLLG